MFNNITLGIYALGLHVNWSLNDPVGFQVLQSRLCIPGTVGTWQNPYPSVDEGERLNEQFAVHLQCSIMATYKSRVCQRSLRARLERTVWATPAVPSSPGEYLLTHETHKFSLGNEISPRHHLTNWVRPLCKLSILDGR